MQTSGTNRKNRTNRTGRAFCLVLAAALLGCLLTGCAPGLRPAAEPDPASGQGEPPAAAGIDTQRLVETKEYRDGELSIQKTYDYFPGDVWPRSITVTYVYSDGLQNVIQNSYDAQNRLLTQTLSSNSYDEGAELKTMTYDENGFLVEEYGVMESAYRTSYTNDREGRILQKVENTLNLDSGVWEQTGAYTYEYDGQALSITAADGTVSQITLDEWGREVSGKTDSGSFENHYLPNGMALCRNIGPTATGSSDAVLFLLCDSAGQEIRQSGDWYDAWWNQTAIVEYDAAGYPVRVEDGDKMLEFTYEPVRTEADVFIAPAAGSDRKSPSGGETLLSDSPSARPVPSAAAETAVPARTQGLSAEDQYEINLFLSNFSEQYFEDYDASQPDEGLLLTFAYLHLYINAPEAVQITEDGMEAMLTADRVNRTLMRFFGTSVSPVEGKLYRDGWNIRCSGGAFYFPVGDGEPYSCMSVADGIAPLSDGTYRVPFEIYSVDEFSTGGDTIIDDSYYALAPEAAATHPDLTRVGSGTAVVRKEDRGRYLLVRYTLDP